VVCKLSGSAGYIDFVVDHQVIATLGPEGKLTIHRVYDKTIGLDLDENKCVRIVYGSSL
jgi:hypothetical protein